MIFPNWCPMNSRLKKFLCLLLAFFALFGALRLYFRLTDDFRISNITYDLPFTPPWKAPNITPDEHRELATIFKQKFSYIGKGAQCYAFVSENGQYVLKFFKFKHLRPNLFVDLLPNIPPFQEFKQKSIARKQHRLIGVFNGYDLAFRENRDTAALIYLQLVPNPDLHLTATVIDKLGLTRNIQLDHIVFLLQKKGDTLRHRLHQYLSHEQLNDAKDAVTSIIAMYISEYKKGIYDHDHGILHNTGFIGNVPFHLDVGKLNKDDRMQQSDIYKSDLEHVLWKIDAWVKANYPAYYPEFTKFLAQQYYLQTHETLDLSSVDPKRFRKQRKLLGF